MGKGVLLRFMTGELLGRDWDVTVVSDANRLLPFFLRARFDVGWAVGALVGCVVGDRLGCLVGSRVG